IMSAKLPEFLEEQYPPDLELKLLQIVHRHGERTPVRRRLEHMVPTIWNLCEANTAMFASIAEFNKQEKDGKKIQHVTQLPMERVLETDGSRKMAPAGCYYGQLTNLGRYRMNLLGERLREFYVDKMKFLPDVFDEESIYLRSSEYPRTQESVLQLIGGGLYPEHKRPMDFTGLKLHIRDPRDDLMFPNPNCYRLRALAKEFNKEVARNMHDKMESLSYRLRHHVKDVSLTSHPSANGILDTLVSAKVHGFPLPPEIDQNLFDDLESVVVHEWFYGAMQSTEVRRLGLGRLMGLIRDRMNWKEDRGDKDKLKLAVYSGHDTTVGPLLIMMDAFDKKWPPFGSAVLFELFKQKDKDQHFVRVRYNENALKLPGCQAEGNHKKGDPTLCTFEAFKNVVREQVPLDWEKECDK
ncbi:putative acid phosphatase SPBC4.06, partial [Choanephora cucurbitarum]